MLHYDEILLNTYTCGVNNSFTCIQHIKKHYNKPLLTFNTLYKHKNVKKCWSQFLKLLLVSNQQPETVHIPSYITKSPRNLNRLENRNQIFIKKICGQHIPAGKPSFQKDALKRVSTLLKSSLIF